MALKKVKNHKGINADYWKIFECDVRSGVVGLHLFVNQETAQDKRNSLERNSFFIEFPVEVSNPLEFAYLEIKKSKIETINELDEEGNVIGSSEVETNWFADSEDI